MPGRMAAVVMLFCLPVFPRAIEAETSQSSRLSPTRAHTNATAKQRAIHALPLEKLDVQGRQKVHGVLRDLTLYRRLPVQVIECDPDLYLFLAQHPDVMVNIWNVLKLSRLQVSETGPNQFRLKETSGTTANLEFLYQSHNTQLLYAEGFYEGKLLPRSVRGRALFLLKTGYLREIDGRYYIASRLDVFLSVEPGAVELVTKTLQPIIGKVADNNFYQTVAFLGSLSRTVELNSRGVQRLSSQLTGVTPQVRNDFSSLADEIAQKPTAVTLRRVLEDLEAARQRQKTIF